MDCEGFRDQVLDVLYEEADPETERRVNAHAETCQACREELAGLREVRGALRAWAVPPMRGATVRRLGPPRYLWASAAAAALLLAVGGVITLSGVSVTYTRGPVVVRLGRAAASTTVVPTTTVPPAVQPPVLVDSSEPVAPFRYPALDRETLLRDMAEMIRQSEARQSLALRAGMTRFEERAALQRRYDLARISAGLSYLDGRAGQQMARTTELMSHVLQASNRREP